MRSIFLPLTAIVFMACTLIAANAFAEDAAPDTGKLYKKCMGCHGKDGKGNPKFREKKNPNLPDFTDAAWQKKRTAEQLKKIIVDGKKTPCKEGATCNVEKGVHKGKMPGFAKKLKPAEIDALVKHVQAFAK